MGVVLHSVWLFLKTHHQPFLYPVPGVGSWNLNTGRNSEITYVNPVISFRRKPRLREAQRLVHSHEASSWWGLRWRPALLAPNLGLLSCETTSLSYLKCSPLCLAFLSAMHICRGSETAQARPSLPLHPKAVC